MKSYSLVIRQTHAEIHTCKCGIRFIFIQAEIDIGYKRECCPWCKPYLHQSKPPPLTHYGTPKNLEDFRSMIYKD